MTTHLYDENSNEWLGYSAAASAVNHIEFANAPTGNAVSISSVGDDTNISIDVVPKGTGSLQISGVDVLPVSGLSTIGANSFDQTVDRIMMYDDSASAHKAVLLQDLGITIVSEASAQTFALGDANTMQKSTSASAVTWTIPTNASVAFEIGTAIQVYQEGAGQVTIAADGGVTLRSPNGAKTNQQYGVACISKVAADEWVAFGDVST